MDSPALMEVWSVVTVPDCGGVPWGRHSEVGACAQSCEGAIATVKMARIAERTLVLISFEGPSDLTIRLEDCGAAYSG